MRSGKPPDPAALDDPGVGLASGVHGDDRLALEPDIPVEVSWADYAAGRDPVLEAARTP